MANADAFELHPRLAADTLPVRELTLSSLCLINDASYPWLILVPRVVGARELHNLAPADQATLWRELMRVFWRLEAAGRVQGGRFVSAVSGEQFALPEAATALWQTRESAAVTLDVASADPLNLAGILVPGPRVPVRLGSEVRIGPAPSPAPELPEASPAPQRSPAPATVA